MNPSASRVRSIAVSLVIVNLCLAGAAQGHPEFNPVTVNRYWKLTLLSPSELRLVYTVMFGNAPALAARTSADANHDGRLDAGETTALGARVQSDVQKSLSLTLDGKPAQASWDPPAVGLAGAEVAPAPFSVDLVIHLRVPPGAVHELSLDDKAEPPALGETEFRVEESPTTTLLASHRGPTGSEKQDRILFRGPRSSLLEDRSITVRFAAAPQSATTGRTPAPRPANGAGRRPWLAAAALALLVVLMGVVVLLRRRR